MTRRLITEFLCRPAQTTSATPVPQSSTSSLTPREREVLRLIGYGLSNAEIAARLFISDTTVKTHVKRILMKQGLRDRVQAVVLAYEIGLVRTHSQSNGEVSPG